MVALRSTRQGWFGGLFGGGKPAKPTSRGNAAAFKAGARSYKANKGPTPELLRVVRLSLENDVSFKK